VDELAPRRRGCPQRGHARAGLDPHRARSRFDGVERHKVRCSVTIRLGRPTGVPPNVPLGMHYRETVPRRVEGSRRTGNRRGWAPRTTGGSSRFGANPRCATGARLAAARASAKREHRERPCLGARRRRARSTAPLNAGRNAPPTRAPRRTHPVRQQQAHVAERRTNASRRTRIPTCRRAAGSVLNDAA